MQERKLSKRVNKEELFDAFKKGGFLRSYTLRMRITGREYREKPLPAKSTTTTIPTASPPKRSSLRKSQVKAQKGFQATDVFDDAFEEDISPANNFIVE